MTHDLPPDDDSEDPQSRDTPALVAEDAAEGRLRSSLLPGLAMVFVVLAGLIALSNVSGSTTGGATGTAGGGAQVATPSTFTIQPVGECTLDSGEGADPEGTSVAVALQQMTQLPAADSVAHASDLAVLADGRLLVTRRDGMVYAMGETAPPGDAVWDVRGETTTSGSGGLIGMAVDPAEAWMYLLKSTPDGQVTVVASPLTAGVPDASVTRPILSVPRDGDEPVGGGLAFDAEGRLLIGLAAGDDDLSGSVLRIQPTPAGADPYTVPPDNPDAGAGPSEVFVDGVVNPYRLSVDPASGDLWLGDTTGECEGVIEVVDSAATDGDLDAPTLVVPEACRILGGFVYHGSALPALDGAFLFGDSCQNYVRALWVEDDGVRVEQLVGNTTPLVAIEPDATGEAVLLASDGIINRLVPIEAVPSLDDPTPSD